MCQATPTARKKRYALVGVSGRSGMYREAVLKTYAAHSEMVGFRDLNLGRLRLAQARARKMAGVEVPIYEARDFDRMVKETKPDVVIVTTKDSVHSDYIIRSMELGCDVMTEKPMTTDEKKCRAILKTQRQQRRVRSWRQARGLSYGVVAPMAVRAGEPRCGGRVRLARVE